ncbi:PAS domain-containing protein [Natrinema zhouii]|nr:PAS domain-containing protein [Natrinema zhouii]UHQ97983.1 PAS domain-containing protein [Natrinema zhouii]
MRVDPRRRSASSPTAARSNGAQRTGTPPRAPQARTRDRTERDLRARLGAFYALNDEWQFTHVNDRAAELLGYTAEELVGENI